MGTYYSAVLLFGVRLNDKDLEANGQDPEALHEWASRSYDDWDKMRQEDGSKQWFDLDNGIHAFQSEYSYDDPEDVYVCCAFFESDDYTYTGINAMPVIDDIKAGEITDRLAAAIREKIGFDVHVEPARWYLMSHGS